MYPRVNYEMTQEDFERILDACKPVPLMFLSGGTPMGRSLQENVDAAWNALGKKMGFEPMTVQPIPGKETRLFSAVPRGNEMQRVQRMYREREEKNAVELKRLEGVIREAQTKVKALLDGDCRQDHEA